MWKKILQMWKLDSKYKIQASSIGFVSFIGLWQIKYGYMYKQMNNTYIHTQSSGQNSYEPLAKLLTTKHLVKNITYKWRRTISLTCKYALRTLRSNELKLIKDWYVCQISSIVKYRQVIVDFFS